MRAIPLSLAALALIGCGGGESDRIDVAAAASLRAVLPDLIEAYLREQPGQEVTVRYGACDALADSVRAGSGFDVVLFADRQSFSPLFENGKLAKGSVQALARSDLVLAGPASAAGLRFSSLGMLGEHVKIGIADPATAPAGRYAERALRQLGVWDALASHLVLGGDVAAVTALVSRGEVAAGLIYETEARTAGLTILDRARGEGAPHPEWLGAPVLGAAASRARDFLRFLASDKARRVWTEYGFAPP